MIANIAVVLHNMGGPSDINAVEKFLCTLFQDRDILPLPIASLQNLFARRLSHSRAPKVAEHYRAIGGGSPLLHLTVQQGDALQEVLVSEGVSARVFVAMRYSEPLVRTTLCEVLEMQPQCILNLPLYPQYSSTTTGSSFNECGRVLDELNVAVPVLYVCDWHDHPAYIDALAFHVRKTLSEFPEPERVHVLFSAHSLPLFIVRRGDVYVEQIRNTFRLVQEKLGVPCPFHLCYQSKLGPIQWMSPTTENTILSIAESVGQDILVVPISFVSDHYETVYEIDIEYAELAKTRGIRYFRRMDSFNASDVFIRALAEIVKGRLAAEGFHA